MIPLRLAQELTFQLETAGELDRLVSALGEIPVFVSLYKDRQSSVLEQWQRLFKAGYDPDATYRRTIADPRLASWKLYPDALFYLQLFFRGRSMYDTMSYFVGLGFELARNTGDRERETEFLRLLGFIDHKQGREESALHYFIQSKELAEESKDKRQLARVLGDIGNIYSSREDFERAMRYYEQQYALSESLLYRDGIVVALGSMATIEHRRGNFLKAIELHRQQLPIFEQMGDVRRLSTTFGNLAIVYQSQAQYETAIELYERQIAISESLGDVGEVGRAYGNYGTLLVAIHQPERAIPLLRRALEIHRTTNFLYGITYWLLYIGKAMLNISEIHPELLKEYLPEIESSLNECIAISKKLSKPDTETLATLELPRVHLAKGDIPSAIIMLETITETSSDLMLSAEAYHRLWKIKKDEESLQAAIQAYLQLIEKNPNAQFIEILDKLCAERILKSTDGV